MSSFFRHPGTENPRGRSGVPLFYVVAPTYTPFSSGVRALYLLCDGLNRLGYSAFVIGGRRSNLADRLMGRATPSSLNAPAIDRATIDANRRRGIPDIVIYPEVVAGNPFAGRRVVRYLLNKPGVFPTVGTGECGANDYFLHFAEEFRPAGLKSQPLTLPTIDLSVYREVPGERPRGGFVLYTNRYTPNYGELPQWAAPRTVVSMARPRPPKELAALYNRHIAIVAWERTAAVGEAIQCGCAAILIANDGFDPTPIVGRYRGNGIAIGWDPVGLRRAVATVGEAKRLYREQFAPVDANIDEFVRSVVRHFAAARVS